jgi:hypothetical protein
MENVNMKLTGLFSKNDNAQKTSGKDDKKAEKNEKQMKKDGIKTQNQRERQAKSKYPIIMKSKVSVVAPSDLLNGLSAAIKNNAPFVSYGEVDDVFGYRVWILREETLSKIEGLSEFYPLFLQQMQTEELVSATQMGDTLRGQLVLTSTQATIDLLHRFDALSDEDVKYEEGIFSEEASDIDPDGHAFRLGNYYTLEQILMNQRESDEEESKYEDDDVEVNVIPEEDFQDYEDVVEESIQEDAQDVPVYETENIQEATVDENYENYTDDENYEEYTEYEEEYEDYPETDVNDFDFESGYESAHKDEVFSDNTSNKNDFESEMPVEVDSGFDDEEDLFGVREYEYEEKNESNLEVEQAENSGIEKEDVKVIETQIEPGQIVVENVVEEKTLNRFDEFFHDKQAKQFELQNNVEEGSLLDVLNKYKKEQNAKLQNLKSDNVEALRREYTQEMEQEKVRIRNAYDVTSPTNTFGKAYAVLENKRISDREQIENYRLQVLEEQTEIYNEKFKQALALRMQEFEQEYRETHFPSVEAKVDDLVGKYNHQINIQFNDTSRQLNEAIETQIAAALDSKDLDVVSRLAIKYDALVVNETQVYEAAQAKILEVEQKYYERELEAIKVRALSAGHMQEVQKAKAELVSAQNELSRVHNEINRERRRSQNAIDATKAQYEDEIRHAQVALQKERAKTTNTQQEKEQQIGRINQMKAHLDKAQSSFDKQNDMIRERNAKIQAQDEQIAQLREQLAVGANGKIAIFPRKRA